MAGETVTVETARVTSVTVNDLAEATDWIVWGAIPLTGGGFRFTPDTLARLKKAQDAFWAEVGGGS